LSASTPVTPPRRKRHWSTNYFALAVLYLGAVNLARAALALNPSSFEQTLPLAMPLPYLAAGGLVWGMVFIAAAVGVWRLRPWARRLLLSAIVIYQAHIWINHFIFDTSDYARLVWPFQVGVSAAWVVAVWGFLFLPGVRRRFVKRDA